MNYKAVTKFGLGYNTLLDLQNSSYPTQPHSIIAKFHIVIVNVFTYKQVKYILSPSLPAQCCFLGFASQTSLFSYHNKKDNIERGEGVKK